MIEDTNSPSKPAQAVVDHAAAKVQGGIEAAQNAALAAGDKVSSTVESIRGSVGPMIDKAAAQAQNVAKQAKDKASAATQQVRVTASQISDSVVSYTQDNPVKALAISAVAGALILTVLQALSSRD